MRAADITIRRLTASDAAAYRAVRLEALEQAWEAFGSTVEREGPQPLSWFAARLENGAVMGAFDGAALVGTAGFHRAEGLKEQHKGYLVGMYVQPAVRGRGVGALLVQAVLDHAADVVELILLAVVDGMPARRLYEKLGFREYGVERRALKYRGQYFDEVLMMKLFTAGSS